MGYGKPLEISLGDLNPVEGLSGSAGWNRLPFRLNFILIEIYIYVTPHHQIRHKSEIQKLRF